MSMVDYANARKWYGCHVRRAEQVMDAFDWCFKNLPRRKKKIHLIYVTRDTGFVHITFTPKSKIPPIHFANKMTTLYVEDRNTAVMGSLIFG